MKIINNEPFSQGEENDIEVITTAPKRIAKILFQKAIETKPSISSKFKNQELRIRTLCSELLQYRNVPQFKYERIMEHFHPESLKEFEALENYLILQIEIGKRTKFNKKNNYKNLKNFAKRYT